MNDRLLAGIMIASMVAVAVLALLLTLYFESKREEREEKKMDDRYLNGHASLQDPEGIQGAFYTVSDPNGTVSYLYVDAIEDYRIQYWTFDDLKRLVDGGEIDVSSTDPDEILEEVKGWANLENADVELEDDWLDLSDLESDGFTGM